MKRLLVLLVVAWLAGPPASHAQSPEAAKALIEMGESKPDAKLDPSELAAWTMIGNILLNLDEVVTKG